MRSRCFVNGVATSLRVLRELGATFVDVNGQGSAVAVRGAATQLALLDRIAGTSADAAAFGWVCLLGSGAFFFECGREGCGMGVGWWSNLRFYC